MNPQFVECRNRYGQRFYVPTHRIDRIRFDLGGDATVVTTDDCEYKVDAEQAENRFGKTVLPWCPGQPRAVVVWIDRAEEGGISDYHIGPVETPIGWRVGCDGHVSPILVSDQASNEQVLVVHDDGRVVSLFGDEWSSLDRYQEMELERAEIVPPAGQTVTV
jgi:hypothetical protein